MIIKQELLNNTVDSTVVINPIKQQIVFFPKEESQMFTGRTHTYVDGLPDAGLSSNPDTESENTDNLAFMQRGQVGGDINLGLYNIGNPYPANYANFKYNMQPINSSHTATDYIGATTINVPTTIIDKFIDFKVYNIASDTISNFYSNTDTTLRVKTIQNGLQTLRIPTNCFNTILTDATAITNNNNSNLLKNYGLYYLLLTPKYIQVPIGNIIQRKTVEWLSMVDNATSTVTGDDIILSPENKRRTIYECDKDIFKDLDWDFESSGDQSGRLYGSIVEVWNSSTTVLKQIKIMTENQFNFENADLMRFVLYPDNVGYDTPDSEIVTGDIVRIYPRESYFNNITIEINYKNDSLQIQNLLAFMLNDTVRDMSNGIFEIYDDKGFTIDDSGIFIGNVLSRYQIFQAANKEARKRIKK